ncbi:DsbA family protein [Streptomyces sp. NBC_00237]|uniref:DsbA family protein n=1 Tax=Streptomyces sp. NBC_00237 TaxID=2975687 RepID=UPI002251E49B|nr:DsbA family protein [Streptomyces sp. NBC_00237]MCX5199881.1 DsbA family protein [Streptomyces sp. NBC_00237]
MPSNNSSNSSSNNNKKRNVLIGAGVALAAAALGLASYSATKPADTTIRPTEAKETAKGPAAEVETDPQSGVYPELEKLARREAGDKLAQGRPDAPVVMVEYADFKCGFCGKFARDTEPELVKKYVDNGTLRIEWRNFPIFGEESAAVARASWAAGQQGRFWQFHSAAYAKGAKEKGFAADRLAELAKEAGVPDLAKFTADANGEAAKASVQKDQTEGYSLNINATPAFLINGRPIAGAMPDDVFVDAIEKAAKTAKSRPAGGTGAKNQGGDK